LIDVIVFSNLGTPFPEFTKLFDVWLRAPFQTGFFSIPLHITLGLPNKTEYCNTASPCDFTLDIEVP
jgi:hypothetical protein